jgi:hypothetical protein
MAVHTDSDPQLAGLQVSMKDTLRKIDEALDSGDRRAFHVWCKRWISLSVKAENLLAKIARS